MKKQEYIQPTMSVVVLKHRCHILAGSGDRYIHTLNSNLDDDDEFYYSNVGNSGDAR